jgi:hypothetical protein
MMIWLACILRCVLEPAQTTLETIFDTNVHVDVSVSFPKLENNNSLARFANDAIECETKQLHDAFAEDMSPPIEELWEEDGDECTLYYNLHLVHASANLLEFYGYHSQYTGGAHGSTQYITKVFWQNGNNISEITLNDLFTPSGKNALFEYCHQYFKENKWGYYSYDDIEDWDPFQPHHLDDFLLTKEGLLLIFQNYTLFGLADDPMTFSLPYAQIMPWINPAITSCFIGFNDLQN